MRRPFSVVVLFGVLLTPPSIHAATSPVLYFDDQTHFEREIAPGETHVFVITLKAGEYVRFAVQPDAIDVKVAIESAGKQISAVDQTGTVDPEVISVIAESDGQYRLLVSTKSAQRGPYIARVEDRRPAVPQDRDRLEAERLFAAGDALLEEGATDALTKAVDLLTRAATLWQRVHDDAGVSDALNDLSTVYVHLGNPSRALDVLWRALALRQCVGNRSRAAVLHHIVIAMQDLGQDRNSILYSKAALREEGVDTHLKAILLYMLGQVHSKLGDEKAALQYYLRTAPLAEASGDRVGAARNLNRLAMSYAALGQWREALVQHGKALELRRVTGDKRGEAMTLINIGALYQDWGDPDRAFEYFEKALPLTKETADLRTEAIALHHIGDVEQIRGRSAKAIEDYEQALKLYREARYRSDECLVLLRLGRVHAAKGEFNAALDYYDQALTASREQLQRAFILTAIAEARSKSGRADDAMTSVNESIEIFRAAGHQIGQAQAMYTRATISESSGHLNDARADAERSLQLIERLRGNISTFETRALFLASYSDISDLYIRVLMRLQDAQRSEDFAIAAFQASERIRARTLIDFLRDSPVAGDPKYRVLLQRQRDIRSLLSAKAEAQLRAAGVQTSQQLATAIGREMDDLSAEYDQIAAQLRAISPNSVSDVEPVSLQLLQRDVIDSNTTLVEYYLGQKNSFVWVATAGSIHSHELPNRGEIEAAVRRAYESFSRPAEARESLAALSRVLVAPLLTYAHGRRLLIVADGALQYLPFGALPSPLDASRPLIADYEIVNIPSGSTVALLRRYPRRSKANKTLAVFADPVFDRNDERVRSGSHAPTLPLDNELVRSAKESGLAGGVLPRLPFTRREANALLALVPREQAMSALDFAASRNRALGKNLSRYRIVHFATHGLLNSLHPDLSGIVLSMVDANGKDQRGFLSVADVFNMSLGADIVVLSGCRTALGKEIKGEGMAGLTRAFMYAGAPRVVASLWKVNDAATAELMKRFYAGMLGSSKLPAPAALRAAQISMSKTQRWHDPYYWAAFVIEGQWN